MIEEWKTSQRCVLYLVGLMGLAGISIAADKPQNPAYLDISLSFEQRAADIVRRMTLDEKVGQMMNDSPAIDRLGVPSYNWWNECLHGVARNGFATVFPQAIGMAASFNPELMLEAATVISDEARAKHHEALRSGLRTIFQGLTFWSPNINIFRDPRWGRGQETYGEDPYLTGQMGVQFVKGLQGDDPKYLKVVSTAKHYAVHSGPEPLRHKFNAVVNKRDLYETYLPAFRDLVQKAHVYSVMGAYNRVDSESASASQMLLVDVLRGQWGFEGYVVSDCGAISDIYWNHKIANSPEEAAAIGVRRGCDLECGRTYGALINAVKKGMITEQEIDLSIFRLMLARMKLGMFDPAERVPYANIPSSENDCPEHDQVALQMARESIVLLKNENNFLPLKKDKIKTIAVIGPNADSVDVLLGNYNGKPYKPFTILKGIKNAVGSNVQVLYAKGCSLVEGFKDQSNLIAVESKYLKTDDSPEAQMGLKGEYFNNEDLRGQPAMTRTDATIDFDWGQQSPTSDAVKRGGSTPDIISNDNFSIRWTGKLIPPMTGVYELELSSDDGCRLFLDGKKLIDDWKKHAFQTNLCSVELEANKSYDITIEYYEITLEARVLFSWTFPQAQKNEGFDTAVEYTRQADVAIFVGGLSSALEGEEMYTPYPGFRGGDRTDIKLPESQEKLLKAMHATGKPVILVLLTGSAVAVNWEQENLPAIVCGWYPGQHGDAVADVLFGNYNPAGRLPVTFYKSVEQLPAFEDYSMQGKTYRYFKGEPLYPFGYGLSYTTFEYAGLKINKKQAKADDTIEVSFKVTNTGRIDGDEVPQLYIRDVESKLPMPIKQLKGFERIALKAGESKIVTMKLTPNQDMCYYDVKKSNYAVEPGDFEIQVGASSQDIRLKGTVTVK
jgi:beta-glucosidase